MSSYISDSEFEKIMNNPKLSLPVRWNGRDFETSVDELLKEFLCELHTAIERNENEYVGRNIEVRINEIDRVSVLLRQCISKYHRGLPSNAYTALKKLWGF